MRGRGGKAFKVLRDVDQRFAVRGDISPGAAVEQHGAWIFRAGFGFVRAGGISRKNTRKASIVGYICILSWGLPPLFERSK